MYVKFTCRSWVIIFTCLQTRLLYFTGPVMVFIKEYQMQVNWRYLSSKMSQNFLKNGIQYLYKTFREIKLLSPELAYFLFVVNCKFFWMEGTVALGLSIQIFFIELQICSKGKTMYITFNWYISIQWTTWCTPHIVKIKFDEFFWTHVIMVYLIFISK